MKLKTLILSLGLFLVVVGVTVGQNTEDAESDVAESEKEGEASLTAEKWRQLTDTEKQINVEIPGPPWETQTQEDLADEQSGEGCIGGSAQKSSIVQIRHKKLKAFASLSELSQPFIFRKRKDLDDYLDKRRNRLEQTLGEDLTVHDASLNTKNGNSVYKIEFTAAVTPGGGCRKAATENKKMVHYILNDHFIRPAGEQEGRIFRLISIALEEKAYPAVKDDIGRFINSFQYTGNKADNLFVPDAEKSKIPTITQGPSKMASWFFLAAIIILVVYMFYRRSRRKQS